MLDNIKYAVVTSLCHLRIEEPETEVQRMLPAAGDMQYIHEANNSLVPIEEASTMSQRELPQKATPFTREGAKVGRNQACPCGSGKKYKQCHGRLQTMA
jgi:preprotein translocase subunit SecA